MLNNWVGPTSPREAEHEAPGVRFLRSYGAMDTMFGYFDQRIEVLQFQGVNRWCYNRAIARV